MQRMSLGFLAALGLTLVAARRQRRGHIVVVP
jgi:hypothetical protein